MIQPSRSTAASLTELAAPAPRSRSNPPDRGARPLVSDAELLHRIAAGERAALGTLYDRHARTMMALGVRILGVHGEVQDVLHDVFLEVWLRAADYDVRRGSVKTWLLVRMRSRCIDRTRSPLVRRAGGDRLHVVEVHFEPRAEINRVRALVSALPAPQQRVMELGYFHGLSISEIAAELAVPIGTVKSRLSAALATLRAALGVAPAPVGHARRSNRQGAENANHRQVL